MSSIWGSAIDCGEMRHLPVLSTYGAPRTRNLTFVGILVFNIKAVADWAREERTGVSGLPRNDMSNISSYNTVIHFKLILQR